MTLNYSYDTSKSYCKQMGMLWLGDDFVSASDKEAYDLRFTQEQVDAAMRHHLWQVKWLFTPNNYKLLDRIKIAIFFIFGGK